MPAEEVKLSGALLKHDRRLTELWRDSLIRAPKGQKNVLHKSLRQKDRVLIFIIGLLLATLFLDLYLYSRVKSFTIWLFLYIKQSQGTVERTDYKK